MPSAGHRKDLGNKHICPECGAKYYDMHRPVPTCPKCGTDPRETRATKTRSPAAARRRPTPARPLRARPPEEDEEEDDDDKAVEVMADPDFRPIGFSTKDRSHETDDDADDPQDNSDSRSRDNEFDDDGGIT